MNVGGSPRSLGDGAAGPADVFERWSLEAANVDPPHISVLLGRAEARLQVFRPAIVEIADVARHLIVIDAWRDGGSAYSVDTAAATTLCHALQVNAVELASVHAINRDHISASMTSLGDAPRASAAAGLGLFLAHHGIIDALCDRLLVGSLTATVEHERGSPCRVTVRS